MTERLRCRAGIWENWREHQCRNAAKDERIMYGPWEGDQRLPACGIHLRRRHCHAYSPRDRYDSPVAEVVGATPTRRGAK